MLMIRVEICLIFFSLYYICKAECEMKYVLCRYKEDSHSSILQSACSCTTWVTTLDPTLFLYTPIDDLTWESREAKTFDDVRANPYATRLVRTEKGQILPCGAIDA